MTFLLPLKIKLIEVFFIDFYFGNISFNPFVSLHEVGSVSSCFIIVYSGIVLTLAFIRIGLCLALRYEKALQI